MTLKKPVKFSSTIIPACLPTTSSEDYLGQKVTTSGWGLMGNGTSTNVEENNGTLMTIDLEVLPISKCEKAKWLINSIEKAKIATQAKLINDSFMICVGKSKKTFESKWMGANSGDSGGELK